MVFGHLLARAGAITCTANRAILALAGKYGRDQFGEYYDRVPALYICHIVIARKLQISGLQCWKLNSAVTKPVVRCVESFIQG